MSWKKCTSDGFLNQEKIFPTAQKEVLTIVRNAQTIADIEKIIVFGSAIESTYTFWRSDIDIYVYQSNSQQIPNLIKGVERPVDYITDSIADERLKSEALRGVTVYEKNIT